MRVYPILICIIFPFLNGCMVKHEKAIEQQRMVQKSMDAAKINTQLGLAYLKQGKRARAKSKFINALSLAPDSADVNAGFAYFLEKSGEIDKAEKYYQKAIVLSGRSGAQLNNYGTFLCRNKRYEEANNYFLKATEDVKYLNVAGAYENAGLCAQAGGREGEALIYFKKALTQDPQRKPSMMEALSLLTKQHDEKSALNLLNQYPELTYQDSGLLKQGIKLAEKTHDNTILSFYQKRLRFLISVASTQSGEPNDNG